MSRILDVPEEGEVAVVGTLYKDMKLKPSILDEYVKDRSLDQQLGEPARGGKRGGGEHLLVHGLSIARWAVLVV